MDINLNINNKQKHWLLVIIEKCKTAIMAFLKGILKCILKCILWVCRLLKKIWKYILGVVIIGGLIIGGVAAYNYYTYTYIPEKKLNAVVEEIKAGINSPNDSIKTKYALYVLDKKHEWGFEDVSDDDIFSRLYGYRESSFKIIEAKAFAGEAECQFTLGQIYYCGRDDISQGLDSLDIMLSFEWSPNNYPSDDKAKAAYWWNEAASQNYIQAYNNIGMSYLVGKGVEIDVRKAVHYLKLGAEAGEKFAQRNYGDLFVDGVKVKVGSHKEEYTDDYKSVFYTKGGSRHYHTVKERDVVDYDFETLIPQDIEQAKYWWKKAAAQGDEVSKGKLQRIY